MKYKSIYQTPKVQAWGKLLCYDWQWFAGLTSQYSRSTVAFTSILLNSIQKHCPKSIYAAAIGPNFKKGDVHIHVLIKNISVIEKIEFQYEWNKHYGQAVFFPYDPKQGGRFYIGSKFVELPALNQDPKIEFETNLGKDITNA